MSKTSALVALGIIATLGMTTGVVSAQTGSANKPGGRIQQINTNRPPVNVPVGKANSGDDDTMTNEQEKPKVTNQNNNGADEETPTNDDNNGERQAPTPNARALERRSAVATAVQALLATPDRVGGIGQQVRVIAQAQNQNRAELEKKVDAIEGRSRIARLLFGPNQKDLDDAKVLLDKNLAQITELEKLQAQVTDKKDQNELDKQIKVLQQADKQIQAVLDENKQGFSIFGWLVRLFNQ